jgi:hypothetical protein
VVIAIAVWENKTKADRLNGEMGGINAWALPQATRPHEFLPKIKPRSDINLRRQKDIRK